MTTATTVELFPDSTVFQNTLATGFSSAFAKLPTARATFLAELLSKVIDEVLDTVRAPENSIPLSRILQQNISESTSVLEGTTAAVADRDHLIVKVGQLVRLFGCQNDFIFFYERRLALRLMRGRSISLDIERHILDLLSTEANAVWTTARTKLREAIESRTLNKKRSVHTFEQFDVDIAKCDDGLSEQPSVPHIDHDFSVLVASAHVWALTVGLKFKLPASISAAMDRFGSFFARESQLKKTLTWVPSQGAVTLQFGSVTIVSSPLIASLLLLFNNATSHAVNDLAKLLHVSLPEVSNALVSITSSSRLLLVVGGAETPTAFAVTDELAINQGFSSATKFLVIRDVVVAEKSDTETSDSSSSWRKSLLDAIIVRAVKPEKDGMPFETLVTHVRNSLASQFSVQRVDVVKRVAQLVQLQYIEEIGSDFVPSKDDDPDENAEKALNHRIKYVSPADSVASPVVDAREPLWPRLSAGLSLQANSISKAEFIKALVGIALGNVVQTSHVSASPFTDTLRALRLTIRIQLASLFGEVSLQHTDLPDIREHLVSRNEFAALGGLLPKSLRSKFQHRHDATLRDFVRWASSQISSGAPAGTFRALCGRLLSLLETEKFAEIAMALDASGDSSTQASGWGVFGMPSGKRDKKAKKTSKAEESAKAGSLFDSDDDASDEEDASAQVPAFGQSSSKAPSTFGSAMAFGTAARAPGLLGGPTGRTGGFGAPAGGFGGGFGAPAAGTGTFGAPTSLFGTAPSTSFGGFTVASPGKPMTTTPFGFAPAPAFGGFGSAPAPAFTPAPFGQPAPHPLSAARGFGGTPPAPFGVASKLGEPVTAGKISLAAVSAALDSAGTKTDTTGSEVQKIKSETESAAAEPATVEEDEVYSSVEEKLQYWVLSDVERSMINTIFAKLASGSESITPETVVAAVKLRVAKVNDTTEETQASSIKQPQPLESSEIDNFVERAVSVQEQTVDQLVSSVLGSTAAPASVPASPAAGAGVQSQKQKRVLDRTTSVDIGARDVVRFSPRLNAFRLKMIYF